MMPACHLTKMGRSQREKGANAEREVAKIIASYGFDARRGQVFNGEPDIVCPALPVHFEIKRQETLKMNEWFAQAEGACGEKYPVVVFRQSRKAWQITMKITDFLALVSKGPDTLPTFRMTMDFNDFMLILKDLYQAQEKSNV